VKNPVSKELFIIYILVVVGLGLRGWGIADIASYTFDEVGQIPSAKSFVATGHADSTFWHHPPVGLILLDVSIRCFGDNPYGWRLRNVILGGMSIALVYLVARKLFADRRIAFMAGLLLALDPLHIYVSRLTMDEIPAIFFFLLGLLLSLSYLKKEDVSIIPAGICFGLSIATKPYYPWSAFALLVIILWDVIQNKQFAKLMSMRLILVFTCIPSLVLISAYFPWFGRGYDLSEFFQFQIDTVRDLNNMTLDWLESGSFLLRTGPSWGWFVIPRVILSGNFVKNPLVWLMILPSMLFVAYRAWKGKDRCLFIIVGFFAATYVPLLLVKRPIFVYSALAVAPFAFIAVAYAVVSLLEKYKVRRWAYWGVTILITVSNLYLYPLATDKPLARALYRPFVSGRE